MSELREAAQAVVAYHDAMYEGAMSDAVIDRLRAALAQPEVEAPRYVGDARRWRHHCYIESQTSRSPNP